MGLEFLREHARGRRIEAGQSRFQHMSEPHLLGHHAKLAALSAPAFVFMVRTPDSEVHAMKATMAEIVAELKRRRREREAQAMEKKSERQEVMMIRFLLAGMATPDEVRDWRQEESRRDSLFVPARGRVTDEERKRLRERLWELDPWEAHVREGGD